MESGETFIIIIVILLLVQILWYNHSKIGRLGPHMDTSFHLNFFDCEHFQYLPYFLEQCHYELLTINIFSTHAPIQERQGRVFILFPLPDCLTPQHIINLSPFPHLVIIIFILGVWRLQLHQLYSDHPLLFLLSHKARAVCSHLV